MWTWPLWWYPFIIEALPVSWVIHSNKWYSEAGGVHLNSDSTCSTSVVKILLQDASCMAVYFIPFDSVFEWINKGEICRTLLQNYRVNMSRFLLCINRWHGRWTLKICYEIEDYIWQRSSCVVHLFMGKKIILKYTQLSLKLKSKCNLA